MTLTDNQKYELRIKTAIRNRVKLQIWNSLMVLVLLTVMVWLQACLNPSLILDLFVGWVIFCVVVIRLFVHENNFWVETKKMTLEDLYKEFTGNTGNDTRNED